MISLKEIKKYLEKSDNPLIFHDDDQDGLCSYLLIKKEFPQATGSIVKAAPNINEDYLEKVNYHNPDLILILDIPIVSQEFIDGCNVPVIWIDHHPPMDQKGVKYFNPLLIDKEDHRPVTHWCYELTKKNLWVAVIGIVADWFLPDFMDKFHKEYPDLTIKNSTKEKILFDSDLGRLIRYFSFILKGKQSQVDKNIKYLEEINSPYEILNKKSEQGRHIYKYAHKIESDYKELLNKALRIKAEDGLILFEYTHVKYSFTGEIANHLIYKNKDKIVLVAREKNDQMKFSLRSEEKPVADPLKNAMKGLEGTGGGHELACGGNIEKDDFHTFVKRLKEELS